MNTPSRKLIALVLVWGAVAAGVGAARLLGRLPVPVIPLVIAVPMALFTAGVLRPGWLNSAVASLGVKGILSVHLVRFIGLYFVWLQAQGRLAPEFAERAGWGDVLAAAGALLLLFLPEGAAFRRAIAIWNWFGLLDLAVAVGTATWLNVTRPGSVDELAGFPLAMVPLWLVPMMAASHIFLLRGTGRKSRIGAGPAESR